MEGSSLKEKRQVVRSIIERLQHRFNISIAETGHLEAQRRVEIGLAAVSNETYHLERTLGKIVNFIEQDGRVQVLHVSQEYY